MPDNYLITGYWGEPHVTAENDRGIHAAIFGKGRFVLPVGEQFRAEYIGNNTVRVYDGKLIDNGAAAGIPAGKYVDLLISEAAQGMKRNDLIVFQYKKNTATLVESGEFVVVKGTETTGTANDPALTQADLLSDEATLDQMALWRVSVSTATISAPVQVFEVLNTIQSLKTLADSKTPKNHASTATTFGVSTASNYGHAKASTTTPKAPGTAAVGSETSAFSRGDHVHPEQVSAHGIKTAGTGAAYTATVEGITALTAGASFIMIPHAANTTTAPTLNVNGLGAKSLRQRLTTNSNISVQFSEQGWLAAEKPVIVTYNGTYWVVDLARPDANSIYGTIKVENGGTGADNAEDARINLGAISAAEIPYIHIWKTFDGNPALVETEETNVIVSKAGGSDGGTHDRVDYADRISVDDGVISLVNPTTIDIATETLLKGVLGKYIYSHFTKKFYFVPSDATVSSSGTSQYGAFLQFSTAKTLTPGGQQIGFATSKERNTYPENGNHTDGLWYVYHKQLGDDGTPDYTYGTADLTAGTSQLETGKLYFVYE